MVSLSINSVIWAVCFARQVGILILQARTKGDAITRGRERRDAGMPTGQLTQSSLKERMYLNATGTGTWGFAMACGKGTNVGAVDTIQGRGEAGRTGASVPRRSHVQWNSRTELFLFPSRTRRVTTIDRYLEKLRKKCWLEFLSVLPQRRLVSYTRAKN
jgi:hypothetical protein